MVCPFRKVIVRKPDRDIETYPECYGYFRTLQKRGRIEMENLENMSIDELVELNRDIQKVLKEKRKARVCSKRVFGSRTKIEIDRDSNGRIKRGVLKIKQRYNSDSYITILASNPDSFKKELLELSESIAMAHMYMTQITNNKEEN